MKQSKSKKGREATAFLYERLSRDDNLDGDSCSIQNQKKLLTKVAKEKGYTNLVHFFDDGISGVTMDRPGFQSMLQEIEKGKAAAVFVKDDCVIKALTPQTLENRHFLRVGTKFRAIQRPQRAAYHIETS